MVNVFMRSLPNMTVIVPCDYTEVKQAVKYAANHKGPFYIRVARANVQTIFDEKGKVEDYVRYKKGKCIAGNYEIRKEWAEKVESLKFDKQADKKGRSDTLKKVLEAGSKESILKRRESTT